MKNHSETSQSISWGMDLSLLNTGVCSGGAIQVLCGLWFLLWLLGLQPWEHPLGCCSLPGFVHVPILALTLRYWWGEQCGTAEDGRIITAVSLGKCNWGDHASASRSLWEPHSRGWCQTWLSSAVLGVCIQPSHKQVLFCNAGCFSSNT